MFAVNNNGNRGAAKTSSLEEKPTHEAPVEESPSRSQAVETICQNAHIKPSRVGYDILRVAEMAASPLLAGMSPEAKRAALLMALEAAGVDLNFMIADAIARQRALNDHENNLLHELKELEAGKAADSTRLQAECDRLTDQCQSRLKSNLEEVAMRQQEFQAWQKRRQRESQRIIGAAMLLVPPENSSGGESLAALLDRAAPLRK